MSNLANNVIMSINTNEDYLDTLQRIIDLNFSSYKAIRDTYFFISNYEKSNKREKRVDSPSTTGKNEDLIMALKKLRLVYEYEQLNLFDWLDNNTAATNNNSNLELSKIKKKEAINFYYP
jgi:hypothetical protein